MKVVGSNPSTVYWTDIFSHIFVFKILMFVSKDENKRKRSRDWPIDPNSLFYFRKCGKAICDSCSTKRSQLPFRGHEFPVRVCEECYIKITDDE